MGIKENLETVRSEIRETLRGAGRPEDDALFLCVTKLHTADEINEAIGCGVTDIGENKVQELLDKYEKVKPVRWHLIGHLQTNKVKYIIDKVCMIHSVDSLKLAKEIDKRAKAAGVCMDILIQTDPAKQETKFGAAPEDLGELIGAVKAECGNVKVRGLMGIAPFADDPEDARPFFREMKKLYDCFGEEYDGGNVHFDTLSLGMTNDFRIALEEGSNLVRIGTAVFGRRDYRSEEK